MSTPKRKPRRAAKGLPALPPSMTLEEIAATHPISVRTLHRRVKAGELKAFNIGRQIRVTLAEVAAWRKRSGLK